MSLLRYNARRDDNEPALVKCLEQLGFHVTTVSGKGVPDLILSRRQLFHLAEIKAPTGRDRPAQINFRAKHSAPVHRLVTVEDCVKLSQTVP